MGKNRRPSAARRPGIVTAALLSAAMLGITGTTTTALAATRSATGSTHSTTAHPAAAGNPASAADGPTMKLIAAARQVEVPVFGKNQVFVDPGIWLASLHSAFQVDVSIAGYGKPERATQLIRTASGVIDRRLPSWVLAHWNGIRHFLRVVVRNSRGKVVGYNNVTFCPDTGYEVSKATPDSAATDPFPQQCASFDPFGVGAVWGLPRGWAADALGYASYRLTIGTYKLTETISPQYVRLFHIARRNATATVKIKVVSQATCCGPSGCCDATKLAAVPAGFVRVNAHPRATSTAARHGPPSLPSTRVLTHVPADALPDLIPLPSWGITVTNTLTKAKKPKDSYVDFGATVWIGGNSPLDVEGFRISGTNTMRAYQYFYRNGKLIGRMRVGTMGFANYNAWHFNQFAQYVLLNKYKKVVVRSRKVGFCIAPTDGVDMLLPQATWQPSYLGLAGNCGDPNALWAQELLPVGWGDTYYQTVPYQNFDITKIRNGSYYIEIIANPRHLLHETDTANDISLRRIIISGKAGHRRVRVPAYHGLDPENGNGGPFF